MKVTQISIGRFHHFHLARQLESFGLLERLWTGYPRWKLKDEPGIPPEKIMCFPWLHTVNMAWSRIPVIGRSRRLHRELAWLAHETLDRRVARALTDQTVLVALSGQGRASGRRARQLGGWHICDRGSSHIRFQDQILREEHRRWKVPYAGIDARVIAKEEAEYENADLITVPSGFAERSFLQMGTPANKMRRIPYGSRIERFRPIGEPRQDDFEVLFVGQVCLRKGFFYLLDAFARLKHPRKRLRIVGSIDPSIENLLKTFPADSVDYLGNVPNTELAALYSTAHAFVLPSIEEGLAMVMAEAMACGCPVIASTHSGAEDLFTDGREGLIVPIRSSEAILHALQSLADQPEVARSLRAAARSRTQAMNGWNAYGRQWLDLLTTLTANGRATRPVAIAQHRESPAS